MLAILYIRRNYQRVYIFYFVDRVYGWYILVMYIMLYMYIKYKIEIVTYIYIFLLKCTCRLVYRVYRTQRHDDDVGCDEEKVCFLG